MPEYEVTIYSDGTATVKDITYSDSYGDYGFCTISAIIAYVIAFIGMVVMLFNVPSTMLFPAIVAMFLFLCPILASLFGGRSIIKTLNAIAKNAYLVFNLFIGMWWLLYSLQTVSESLLIGILVVTMYSMYYFPVILIYDSSKRDTALGVVGAVVSFLAALTVYLIFLAQADKYENFSSFMVVIFSTIMTVSGTLFLLANRFIYLKREGAKLWRNLLLPMLYVLLAVAVALGSFVLIPNLNRDRYDQAVQYVAAGEYAKAREAFASLGRYRDASAQYDAIRYVSLEVGEKVIMGTQTDGPDDLYGENPISWTVVAVEDGKALLLCDAILTSINSNPLNRWTDDNSVRSALRNMEGCFTEEERARILSHTYTVESEKGSDEVSDKLFLLSREELEQYCAAEQIFSKKDSPYNDRQALGYMKADFDYTYIYAYYVRNVNEKGEWIIADCEDGQFISRSNAYLYVGIRPAMYISLSVAE